MLKRFLALMLLTPASLYAQDISEVTVLGPDS
jgi:hypothetical protein